MSKSEKKKGRAGAFVGGTFFGILLVIGLIAGLVCLIYFKVSPNWINKTFKTDISLGSDKLDEKTLNQLVKQVNGAIKNKDTYTLNDLNNDFGIKFTDNLAGIDISNLKDVGLSNLGKQAEKKFGTISAYELRNVNGMNLKDQMGHILDKTNTYYLKSSDNKLYKTFDGTTYSDEVNFDYTINEAKTKVTTKGHETVIDSGVAEIQLWYLPISVALGDFTKNMGENITLSELQSEYGVNLPDFLQADLEQKNANKTVNELSNIIDTLYIGEILNYTVDASNATSDTDYENIIVKDGAVAVTGVIGKIAKLKVGGMETGVNNLINTLTLTEVFGTQPTEGVLSLISGDTTVEDIPSAIQTAVSTKSIGELNEKGVISLDDANIIKLQNITIDDDNNPSTDSVALITLNAPDLLNYLISLLPSTY